MGREHLFFLLLLERVEGSRQDGGNHPRRKLEREVLLELGWGIKPSDDCGWEVSVNLSRDRKACLESSEAKALRGAGAGSGRSSSSRDGVEQPRLWLGWRLGLWDKDDGKTGKGVCEFHEAEKIMM